MKPCPYQGKRKFRSERGAVLWNWQRKYWVQNRPYLCPHCGFWHLTSQARREAA